VAILDCVDWIAHGFEIVESPFPGWKFKAADTVAACAMHAALLVGEPRSIERLGADVARDIVRFTVTLACDGKARDRGVGANALGSPLAAVAHLAAVLAKQCKPLAAGELVTTGTLTGAPAIRPGESWSTTLDGIDLPGLTVKLEA
jgi:2-oxo-3-hexenedioate decarboxylase